jgi:hypothetical protein
MAFTAPHEAPVVTVAKRAELVIPKRVSLPSRLPIDWSTPSPRSAGLSVDSLEYATSKPTRKSAAMAARIDQPCFWSPAMRPYV